VSVCVIGIGYYTAVDLARRNARVILACRNTQTAAVAAAQMRMQTGNENVVVQELDLSLLKSVRKFASVIFGTGKQARHPCEQCGHCRLHHFFVIECP